MMIFTGLVGYCWATAALDMRQTAPSAMARKIVIIGTFSLIGRYRARIIFDIGVAKDAAVR